ncbi:hypothetical protein PDESU_01711 [Pontiella desulfatans]|uniref:Glycosyl-hydrolase family 116 catalytic region domain-containing protein n=1 Tax=Pontiella desulfatans TaxID=2750659 RepID=A0A6C2TZV6_PONDE|nr:GH116 family glycosyl hydrolase [Pontiella desulfatans]VGO13157.1 hypothetical protein PDESU_01711 [Pontiella desulfatans]
MITKEKLPVQNEFDLSDREGEVLHGLYEKGSKGIAMLYNGEYYVQEEEPAYPKAIGVGPGVYVDQVIGQFWANQLGLVRLYNKEHMQSALNTLWKHNFVPDVESFRKTFTEGRYYAWTGDSALIMCTWPNGGLNIRPLPIWWLKVLLNWSCKVWP